MRTATRLLALPLAAGSLVLTTVSPVEAAETGLKASKLAPTEPGFWTEERMRVAEAHPRDMPARESGPAARKPVPPITKGTVVDSHGKAPAKMIGRLYIVDQVGNLYTCSATVINSGYPKKGKGNQSVVLTAGHCVSDPTEGFESKSIVFKPDYSDGNARKGLWGGQWVYTYSGWHKYANPAYDYSMIAMAKHSDGPIQKYTGGQSLLTKYKKRDFWTRAYGYAVEYVPGPKEYPDRGEKLRMCKGHTKSRSFNGSKFLALKCDLFHGASGGPLIAKYQPNGYGRVISVLSFRKVREDGYLYAPIFNSLTQKMFLKVRNKKTATWNMDGVEIG